MIECNLIHASYLNKVKKLLFLGSSCIYPKNAEQPIKEEYLLSGYLEKTNKPYAIAKIAGIELCESYKNQYGCNFISAMPTNLYGPNDNFDIEDGHVLPALISKFHKAKITKSGSVTLWGDGSSFREFLHVDDLGQAVLFALENKLEEHLYNVGTGVDLTIEDLARIIQSIVGHQGEIEWDANKPDGTPRKLLSIQKILRTGWKPKVALQDGITGVYQIYKSNN